MYPVYPAGHSCPKPGQHIEHGSLWTYLHNTHYLNWVFAQHLFHISFHDSHDVLPSISNHINLTHKICITQEPPQPVSKNIYIYVIWQTSLSRAILILSHFYIQLSN